MMEKLSVVSSRNRERGERLLALQKRQLEHDKAFHADIFYNLSPADRLKHYTLHYAKYAARMISSLRDERHDALVPIVVDAFIITLTFANALNKDLGKFASSRDPANDTADLVYEFVAIVGDMAKAAESIDHVESGNFRADIEAGVEKAFTVLQGLGTSLDVDLTKRVNDRWAEIEENSIFN